MRSTMLLLLSMALFTPGAWSESDPGGMGSHGGMGSGMGSHGGMGSGYGSGYGSGMGSQCCPVKFVRSGSVEGGMGQGMGGEHGGMGYGGMGGHEGMGYGGMG